MADLEHDVLKVAKYLYKNKHIVGNPIRVGELRKAVAATLQASGGVRQKGRPGGPPRFDAGRLLDWCIAFASMIALELAEAQGSRERIQAALALARHAPTGQG